MRGHSGGWMQDVVTKGKILLLGAKWGMDNKSAAQQSSGHQLYRPGLAIGQHVFFVDSYLPFYPTCNHPVILVAQTHWDNAVALRAGTCCATVRWARNENQPRYEDNNMKNHFTESLSWLLSEDCAAHLFNISEKVLFGFSESFWNPK